MVYLFAAWRARHYECTANINSAVALLSHFVQAFINISIERLLKLRWAEKRDGAWHYFSLSNLSLLASCTLLVVSSLLYCCSHLIKWHTARVLYLETEQTKMLRSNCILLVLLLWAYLPNFSSFRKFKAKLACCQVSAIYLVNCHFPFLGLWCSITPLPSHQNASFWLRFIPKTFLYNSSKFHSNP